MSTGIVNWHWREKDVKPWAEQWLRSQIEGLSVEDVSIEQLSELEVGMRKSKLITIYDLKVITKWQGPEVTEGDRITGTLTAVEVSHDMDESDYVFEASTAESGSEANRMKEIARKQLAAKLRPIFQQLPKEMISVHGKDLLQDTNGSPSTGGMSTSSQSTNLSTAVPKASSVAPTKSSSATTSKTKAGNTTTVKVDAAFAISANDLFELMTDESKVPAWTRNPAKIRPEAGAEISLFGGNITGKVVSAKKPTEFISTWRAPTWPKNHFGTLRMEMAQGSSDTTLTLRLDGVPLGKEEETEKNLDIYYIRSLKQIGEIYFNTWTRRLIGDKFAFGIGPLAFVGLMLLVIFIAKTIETSRNTSLDKAIFQL